MIDYKKKSLSLKKKKFTKRRETSSAFLSRGLNDDCLLQASIEFPSLNEQNKMIITIPLAENQWENIRLQIPEPNSLKNKPIIFKPLNSNGLIMISEICIFNEVRNKIVWTMNKGDVYDQLLVHGSAYCLPDRDNLLLLSTGNDPMITFAEGCNCCSLPLNLRLRIKVTIDQGIIDDYVIPKIIDNTHYLLYQHVNTNHCILKRMRIPEDEEAIVNYLMDNERKINNDDAFNIYCELARYHIINNNHTRSIHFLNQIKKYIRINARQQLKIAEYYLALNQHGIAFEHYVEGLINNVFIDEHLKKSMLLQFDNFRNATERFRKIREHGHRLLIDYLLDNLEHIKSKAHRKLTVIEVGSTREEDPDQGSTVKLANFCNQHDLNFITIDMDPQNTKLAQHDLSKINKSFQAVNQKGEDFFKKYHGKLDFVFLDAYDCDHGRHSELRQKKYKEHMGDIINNESSFKMHLECVMEICKKISLFGAICIDDTFFKQNIWIGKGSKAVPYLLKKNYCVVKTGNNGVLLAQQKQYSKKFINSWS